MTPKADLSCRKPYKKWYYIIFYLKKRAEILHLFVFKVVLAAILNLTSRGHQRSRPFCLRWILKTHCPYLTPCKISKTCHQVHKCYEFRPRYIDFSRKYKPRPRAIGCVYAVTVTAMSICTSTEGRKLTSPRHFKMRNVLVILK